MPNLGTASLVKSALQGRFIYLDDSSLASKGDFIIIDREAALITDASQNPIKVMRGYGATANVNHQTGTLCYFAKPEQVYHTDPLGIPHLYSVNPWINLDTGYVWVIQGDDSGPNVSQRYWQLEVTGPRTAGALGILSFPPPSTP